jgi:predicted secreted protein
MATLVGNDGAVTLNGVAVAAVRNFTIDITADTIENTTMGSDSRTFVRGPASYSGSLDVYFDPANFNGNVAFNPTSGTVGQANYSGVFYLVQDAVNDVAFTCSNMVVTGYSINSTFDGLVEASISVQGSGAVVFSQTGNV